MQMDFSACAQEIRDTVYEIREPGMPDNEREGISILSHAGLAIVEMVRDLSVAREEGSGSSHELRSAEAILLHAVQTRLS